jgi:hypothetical protein
MKYQTIQWFTQKELYKNTKNTIETFDGDCPTGYYSFGCPNPDVQDVHDGAGGYYINANSGKIKLPDPGAGPGCVGWSVIVTGGSGGKVTTNVAKHMRRGDSPGYGGGPGPINPDEMSFTNNNEVKKIEAWGNQGMSYCFLPPPTAVTNINIINKSPTGFSMSWSGDNSATSYSFMLDGTPVAPSKDDSIKLKSVTFSGLISGRTYSIIVNAINLSGKTPANSTVTLPPGPPTPVATLTFSNQSSKGFTATWSGGDGATSYLYNVNGTAITPVLDNGVASKTVNVVGLTSGKTYTFDVTAMNTTGGSTVSGTVTTLAGVAPAAAAVPVPISSLSTISATATAGPTKPPPVTENTAPIESIKTSLSVPGASPSTVISTALASQTPTNVITAVLANGTPAVFTALVNTPSLQGTSITIKADDAVALYNTMSKSSIIDTTKPLVVSIPSATGSITSLVPGSNTKLAIDLTVAKSYPILDIAGKPIVGYSINVVNGIQYYITPLNPTGTPIDVGTTISIPTSDGNMNSFTVADLDVVFVPAISTVSSSTISQLPCPIVKCSESTGRCPIPYQLYGTIILGVIITTIILTVLYLEL